MASKVLMEALSPTMEEGRLVEWKKNEGDPVRSATSSPRWRPTRPSWSSWRAPRACCSSSWCRRAAPWPWPSWSASWASRARTSAALAGRRPSAERAAAAAPRPRPRLRPLPPLPSGPRRRRLRPPPAVGRRPPRSRARSRRERGLDLGAIAGSGPEGRVVLPRSRRRQRLATAPAFAAAGGRLVRRRSPEPDPEDHRQAAGAVDRAGPHLLPHDRSGHGAGVGGARGAQQAGQLGDEGKVSFNDIIMKATAAALRRTPPATPGGRTTASATGTKCTSSMAVAVEDGLITPVIRARRPEVAPRDLRRGRGAGAAGRVSAGSSPRSTPAAPSSVSNLGMFDIDQFTAIINPPEAGILAVGSIVEQAVVNAGRRRAGAPAAPHHVLRPPGHRRRHRGRVPAHPQGHAREPAGHRLLAALAARPDTEGMSSWLHLTSSSSAADPPATSAPSAPPSSASAPPWSRRTSSAASASTSAASRPRPCCTAPPSINLITHRGEGPRHRGRRR